MRMDLYTQGLMSARQALLDDLAKQTAAVHKQVEKLNALLAEHGAIVAPPSPAAPKSPRGAPGNGKRRGRPPGKKAAAAAPVVIDAPVEADASAATPAVRRGRKPGRKPGAKKAAAKKGAAKPGRGSGKFNVTAAVRDLVAGFGGKSFTVGDVREAFEKAHPGVLATLNRIALSLALQSMGRSGQVKTSRDPANPRQNIFTAVS
jgi:hypothetical protein